MTPPLNPQVLRFYAYFKEGVVERPDETWRLRKCTMYYYLEDDTLQVSEPKVDNSGLPQGIFLRRHRVKNAEGDGVTFKDLVVGTDLELYSRVFHIIGCDGFTREFLASNGIAAAENGEYPAEPFIKSNATRLAATKQRRSNTETSNTFFSVGIKNSNFFENDRKVLRFFGTWDDTTSLFGDQRAFILHYYLSNDTIEVLELQKRNSGRDPFPLLLHRMKLPKHVYEVGVRPMSASARARAKYEYYGFRDLKIGATVMVYGRPLLLHDCDDFTKKWLLQNMGVPAAELEPIPVKRHAVTRPDVTIPPRDAFTIGSDQDTEANCRHLIPKPRQMDVHKFIANEGKVLRFTGQLQHLPPNYPLTSEVDKTRSFIISFYLVDSTLQIFEPPQRNSGVVGGKFLERAPVHKPGAARKLYTAMDMFVDSCIVVYGRVFRLTKADDYTLSYMEDNCEDYPASDIHRIAGNMKITLGMQGLEALKGKFIDQDGDGSGLLGTEALKALLDECGCKLSTHEVITLARACSPDGASSDTVSFSALLDRLE